MNDETPVGQRFSQIYLERGAALRDSIRFRRRLERAFFTLRQAAKHTDFALRIESDTGCKVPWGPSGRDWGRFFEEAELRDVLDCITSIVKALEAEGQGVRAAGWMRSVRAILPEENVGYRIDSKGGLHPLIDEEFERSRVASLAGLGAPRYGATREHFERAHAAFDSDPPDTRGAVRHIFDSLETVFKLALDNSVSRLGASEIEKSLKPQVLSLYEGAAHDNAGRMLASFKEWTNGAHQYRHAQGGEQPTPPPLDLAVMIVSSGAAWLRWLIEIDGKISLSDS